MSTKEREELCNAIQFANMMLVKMPRTDAVTAAVSSLIKAVSLLARALPTETPGEQAERLWHEAEAAGADPVEALTRAGFTVRKVASEKVEPATFDEGLVERLVAAAINRVPAPEGHTMMEFTPEHRIKSTRHDVLAILSELAAMPVEMPSARNVLAAFWNNELINVGGAQIERESQFPEQYGQRVVDLFRARLGPILAAKDAERAELKRAWHDGQTQFEAASYQRDQALEQRDAANVRATELEKRLAEAYVLLSASQIGDGSGARNIWFAHLQRQNKWSDDESVRAIFDASFDAGARCARDFDGSLRTPVDATGKTPGDVAKEAFSASVHAHHESKGISAWEDSAKAVLHAFGVEALRRVRERICRFFGRETAEHACIIIDDELAKLGGQTKPCHCQLEAGDSPCPLHGENEE